MSKLLARYAEDSFWMARYLERCENLARILDVNETFGRDSRGGEDWLPIVQLHADDEAFFAKHKEATDRAVLDFYVLDRANISSIASMIRIARENARTQRHLISTEMWERINTFHGWVADLRAKDIDLANLSRLCTRVRTECQTLTGIVEGTLYRDQATQFFQIGKYMERADQSTRLLDIKYHRLLPSVDHVGSPLDISQWNAVLRSMSGYHAFRRVHPSGMTPAIVCEFVLFDTRFPRSVKCCLGHVHDLLESLRRIEGLKQALGMRQSVEAVLADMEGLDVNLVLADGLHEYLDGIQAQIIQLTDKLGRAFFGHDA